MLFLDLDRFKEINDTHGHLAGSTTLAEFGRLLRETVERPGATLARYGGDEFVLLLPETGRDEARAIGEAICRETAAHVFLNGPWGEDEAPLGLEGIITASIGVSTLEGPPRTSISRGAQVRLGVRLLQCADKAMYASKAGGEEPRDLSRHGPGRLRLLIPVSAVVDDRGAHPGSPRPPAARCAR